MLQFEQTSSVESTQATSIAIELICRETFYLKDMVFASELQIEEAEHLLKQEETQYILLQNPLKSRSGFEPECQSLQD